LWKNVKNLGRNGLGTCGKMLRTWGGMHWELERNTLKTSKSKPCPNP
jgi:hypothetical protein